MRRCGLFLLNTQPVVTSNEGLVGHPVEAWRSQSLGIAKGQALSGVALICVPSILVTIGSCNRAPSKYIIHEHVMSVRFRSDSNTEVRARVIKHCVFEILEHVFLSRSM